MAVSGTLMQWAASDAGAANDGSIKGAESFLSRAYYVRRVCVHTYLNLHLTML
jgi:hypothetical protein